MKKTTLYVVRHGQSEHNRDEIVSGHVNPALTVLGKEQAAETAAILSHVNFDEAYSSDLDRARHTGEIIYGQKIPVDHQLVGLREKHFGAFEGEPGQTYRDLVTTISVVRDTWTEDKKWRTPHAPDMESDHDVATRFIDELKGIANKHPGKTILVAAHGATIRTTLVSLGYAEQAKMPSGSVQNAAFAKIAALDGKLSVVETHNISFE